MQTQEKWKNTIETETYMAQCLFQYIFSLLIIVLKKKKKKKNFPYIQYENKHFD